MSDIFHAYNLAVGLATAGGLAYLLYTEHVRFGYRRFFDLLVAGLLVFAVGSPLVELVAPSYVHLVHALAALLVILGLYDPVHNDLRRDEWAELLLTEPREFRKPADWMVPMDDRILELFHSAHLVLTPAIIAYNIDHSREEVNRRLSTLEEHDLIERVERGKYRITEHGEQYLQGQLHVALLERTGETGLPGTNQEGPH
jgi:predicted transcriptional regulator